MKGKKICLTVLAVLVAALLLLGGCAKKTTETAAPAGKDAGQSEAPLTLRMVTEYSPDEGRGQVVQGFADNIMKQSNGKIKIEVYYEGQLFKSEQVPDAIASGSIDLVYATFAKGWPNIVPQLNILDTGIFSSIDEGMKCLNGGDLGKYLDELLEQKGHIKVLGWSAAGVVDALGCTKRQIKKIEDMKGLRARIAANTQLAQLEAYGATGVVMSPTDMYLALQKGTIDTVYQSSGSGVVNNKLPEVAKYWTRVPLAGAICSYGFVIRTEVYNNLSPDLQKIVMDCGKAAAAEMVVKTDDADMQWEKIKSFPGVQVYVVPAEEVPAWKAVWEPTRYKVLEKTLSKEEIKKLEDLVKNQK